MKRRGAGRLQGRRYLTTRKNLDGKADAIFTSRPEIRNGRIENTGDVWVIMNSAGEELEDFFREGIELWEDELCEIPIKSDPKPVMCLGIKGKATVIMGEAKGNADYLLSKIISGSFRGLEGKIGKS
ncbi:MAG: hypothetical protein AB1756_00465 [Acidobacteriota bacterium]